MVELKWQGELRELKERQQQEIDLQIAKQLQLDENAQTVKQNQAAEIGQLMAVIDKRNGKLEKNMESEKETGSHSGYAPHRYVSHNIDGEATNGIKTPENMEEPWPAHLLFLHLLLCHTLQEIPKKTLKKPHFRRTQRNITSQEQCKMVIKGIL